jgi:hypothetical protein
MPKIEEFCPSRASGSNDPIFKKDEASRGAQAAQARALRERLRCASDTIILGILDHF